ncbi:TlpA family protein disulfide reductase [Bartonella sp. DGB2]|uniref:TlpA family protein disulfide reductase n=1 Tax=Bartonella sp. DGB2 TaxID=3388426 RepID=UPI00399034CA
MIKKLFIYFLFLGAAVFIEGGVSVSSTGLLVSSAIADSTTGAVAQKVAVLKAKAQGFFKNIRFANQVVNLSDLRFQTRDGQINSLRIFHGKPILLNIWAIWCAPCRKEMPELAILDKKLGGNRFQVVAVNVDRVASNEKIDHFLQEVNAQNLILYRDSTMVIFNEIRRLGLAIGLPVTLIVDKDGFLLGSFNGLASWGDKDAQNLMDALIAVESEAVS